MSERPEEILGQILRLMGFPVSVGRRDEEDESGTVVDLQIDSDDGLIIGRRGKNLEALEWIMRVVSPEAGGKIRVDCGGYRERRRRMLREMVARAIEQVRRSGETVSLGPFFPAERRIVHQMIMGETGLTTASEGDGWEKLVRILPRREE